MAPWNDPLSSTLELGRRVTRSVLMRLPEAQRGWIVRRAPTSIVGTKMLAGALQTSDYFEGLYADERDPYGFDDNPNEQLKFAHLLEVCGPGPFRRAFELGCAVGTFTELLAPRCSELVAVDISAEAVSRTKARVAHLPGVACETRVLPRDMPAGPFDLIVASDVLYYWSEADVEESLVRLEGLLSAGGSLVVAHYVPSWGVLLTGDEAHDIVRRKATTAHVREERVEFGPGRPYRVDRYDRIAK